MTKTKSSTNDEEKAAARVDRVPSDRPLGSTAPSNKPTPGPWTVILRGERGTFHIPEAQKHEAEHSDDGVDGYTVSKANARLIAAAPELLASIRDLLKVVDVYGYTGGSRTRALAALAKAEGVQ